MNWFDLIIIILIIASLIKGYISGFVMQLASLCGIILGAIFAGKLSEAITPKLIDIADGTPHIMGPISYIIAFVIILIVMLLLGKAIQSVIKAMELNFFNRIAGAIFCSAKWLILFSILLNLITEMDQNKLLIKKDVRENTYTYAYVKKIAPLAIPYLRFDWINSLHLQ